MVELFHGQLKSKVTCRVCQRESVRFDPFNYLSLPLPLESYVHVEVVGNSKKKNKKKMIFSSHYFQFSLWNEFHFLIIFILDSYTTGWICSGQVRTAIADGCHLPITQGTTGLFVSHFSWEFTLCWSFRRYDQSNLLNIVSILIIRARIYMHLYRIYRPW